MRAFTVVTALAVSAGLFSASCASSRTGTKDPAVSMQNELSIEQIRASGSVDALEAVQRLRPLWLRTRAPSSVSGPNEILVYQNSTRLGGLEALRGYPLDGITKIRYLTASEAANRLPGTGSTVVEGAIVISTRPE